MKLAMAKNALQAGRLDEAELLFTQVLGADPDNVQAIWFLSDLRARQGKSDQCMMLLRRAIELEPANPNFHLQLARQYASGEQIEQARECFRRVLELQPHHVGSLIALANTKRQSEVTDRIRVMEALYRDPDLAESDRRRLSFALGKVFDDLGEFEKAFRFFEAGNRIARASYQLSNEAEASRVELIKQHFAEEFFQRYSGTGIADDCLILIVGMPRSGTSLVEQILASHPAVFGAGEALVFPRIVMGLEKRTGTHYPLGFDNLSDDVLQEKGRQYIGELKGMAGPESYVTDKNISSITYLGLISVMLPNAKIVYCSRNPLDQGLSFFQKDFGAQQPCSYDLQDIGRYYNRCRDMMAHWTRMLPGRIHAIRYEDIVSDFERSVHGLLAHCELSFDEACLSFHGTERVIGTASRMQVRQPLYSSSVGRWKDYEQQLQPLVAELTTDSLER